MKRDMEERLGDVLRKIAEEKRRNEQNYLWIRNHSQKLFYREIIYVSKVKGQKYSEYITVKDTYRERMSLHQIQTKLDTDLFIMVGRSYLVNIEHVAGISSESVRLDNGEIIGAGHEVIREVKEKVTMYWRNH